MKNSIFFVCGSYDYHSIDWYRSVQKVSNKIHTKIITDDFSNKNPLLKRNEIALNLINIKPLLLLNKTFLGDLIRNFFKLIVIPLNAYKLNVFYKRNKNSLFHAHSMYYIFLCWFSNIKYISTPMGSDVLVRPRNNFIYKIFTILSLKKSDKITVDSVDLYDTIIKYTSKKSYIIQNGVNTKSLLKNNFKFKRNKISSIRAIYPNYQIEEIINSMKHSELKVSFFYPFYEKNLRKKLINNNKLVNDLESLSKNRMYSILKKSKLCISIPISDSSPRSVYEAIFSGSVVAVTDLNWLRSLTECMKERIIIVDIKDKLWLENAVLKSKKIIKNKYVPSSEAINKFDQFNSMKYLSTHIYKFKI